MDGAQSVDDVEGVEAGVVGDDPGDDFQRLGEHVHHELLLALDGHRVVLQSLRQLHLRRAAAGHNGVGLEAAPHDHDGVVQRPLRLLDELLSASSQDDGGGFGLGKKGSTFGHSSKRL